MKRILRENKNYLTLLFVFITSTLLISCNGVEPANPIINSFSADVTTIEEGESATLSWEITDASAVTIDQGIGTVDLSASISVSPTVTTTYTLTANHSTGSSTATVTITVNPLIIIEQNMTIQPGPEEGKDSYINSFFSSPDYSAGTYPDLSIGNPFAETVTPIFKKFDYIQIAYDTLRSFLQFDLSLLPANAIITNANLKLYQYYTLGSEDLIIGLHQVTETWEEDTINWNNKPNYLSVPESIVSVTVGETTWLSWDITALLQGWLDGSITNHGLMLKSTEEFSDNSYIACYSSDYMDDPALRPKIEIDYYLP